MFMFSFLKSQTFVYNKYFDTEAQINHNMYVRRAGKKLSANFIIVLMKLLNMLTTSIMRCINSNFLLNFNSKSKGDENSQTSNSTYFCQVVLL